MNKNKGFFSGTLLELIVLMTILGILIIQSYNTFGDRIRKGQAEDDRISDIVTLGNALASVIAKNGDMPSGYCRDGDGGYVSANGENGICYPEDPKGNGVGECSGIGSGKEKGCDDQCMIVECSVGNDFCASGGGYVNFIEMIGQQLRNPPTFRTKDFMKSISVKICKADSRGKATHGVYQTFNPSISIDSNERGASIERYRYDSTP